MAIETGTYISDLVVTNPLGTDLKSQGDDHLRLLKSTIKTTFPNVAGAVAATHTELGYVAGVTSAIQTQLNAPAKVASVNGGQLAGTRSRIINGNFPINQRGVSGTVTLAANVYGHDRWKAGSSGCTYTFAASANGMLLTITAGTLIQTIEGANLEGGTFILSWFGTATGRIDAGAYGSSGVTSTAVAGVGQSVEFSTGTLTRVQYEFGSIATVFEQRLGELALCQRFYEKSFPQGIAPSTSLGSNTAAGAYQMQTVLAGASVAYACISYKVTKRAAPATITGYSPIGAGNQPYNSSFGACTGLATASSDSTLYFSFTSPASTTVGNSVNWAWTADAEIY